MHLLDSYQNPKYYFPTHIFKKRYCVFKLLYKNKFKKQFNPLKKHILAIMSNESFKQIKTIHRKIRTQSRIPNKGRLLSVDSGN